MIGTKTQDMNAIGIYVLTSPSGRQYVGKTEFSFRSRIEKYRNCNCKTQKKLYNAIKKYGWENFTYELYEIPNDPELISMMEIEMIELLDTYNNGYNLTIGGEGMSGYKHTDESKAKISAASLGRKHSDEAKSKMSAAKTGRKHTDETKAKRSKPVQQICKDTGTVIKTWPSAMEAGRNGFNFGNICACCRGVRPQYKGHIWRYVNNNQ